jgi:quinol-cytochrome oxidoreductase complex cytochrome b subunit
MPDVSEEKDTIPFYPDHVRTEVKVLIAVLALAVITGVIGLLNPVGLEEPADPMVTPTHTKPEWYFLFLYQVLKYVPKTFGAILPFIGIGLLILWPWIDHRANTQKSRRNRIISTTVVMLAIVVLTILGTVT